MRRIDEYKRQILLSQPYFPIHFSFLQDFFAAQPISRPLLIAFLLSSTISAPLAANLCSRLAMKTCLLYTSILRFQWGVMSVVPISAERLMIIGDFPIRRAKVMNVLYRSLRAVSYTHLHADRFAQSCGKQLPREHGLVVATQDGA